MATESDVVSFVQQVDIDAWRTNTDNDGLSLMLDEHTVLSIYAAGAVTCMGRNLVKDPTNERTVASVYSIASARRLNQLMHSVGEAMKAYLEKQFDKKGSE